MLSCITGRLHGGLQNTLQGARASESQTQILPLHQVASAAPSATGQETSPPLAAPLSIRQEHSCKPKASSIVMGVSLLGLGISIGLYLLSVSQGKEQDGSSEAAHNLKKLSFFLFAVSLCAAGVSSAFEADRGNRTV